MQEIKILIFEDNPSLRDAFSLLIDSTDGFELLGAYPNCLEVLGLIKKYKPDVLLMDIDMPGMSGIEAVKLIRPDFPEVNILMLTVFDDDERVFDSLKAGATGYLLKKTDPEKILEAIIEMRGGGAPMSPSIARKVIQSMHTTPKHMEEFNKLTSRELEVLTGLSEGKSAKMIAEILCISVETVRTHIRKTYEKLHVHSVTEALVKYNRR